MAAFCAKRTPPRSPASSLHGDRARDARDHHDRVVQRHRADGEIEAGPLERMLHLAEHDIVGVASAATGTAVAARAGKGGGDRTSCGIANFSRGDVTAARRFVLVSLR